MAVAGLFPDELSVLVIVPDVEIGRDGIQRQQQRLHGVDAVEFACFRAFGPGDGEDSRKIAGDVETWLIDLDGYRRLRAAAGDVKSSFKQGLGGALDNQK